MRTRLLFTDALSLGGLSAQACHRHLGCTLVPLPHVNSTRGTKRGQLCTQARQQLYPTCQPPDTPSGNSNPAIKRVGGG